MCGRYTLSSPGPEIAKAFELAETPALEARFNIAPTQLVPVVRVEDGARRLRALRWGLVPHWAKDLQIGTRMINARSETAAEKPAFREALRARRCLVPADGFFEWLRGPGGSQPFWFRPRDRTPFGMAGLWERWSDRETGEVVESCSILTTDANAVVRPVHDRMPVILARESYRRWLDPRARNAASFSDLLVPCPATWLETSAVSRRVNNARYDGPGCVAPAEAPPDPGKSGSAADDEPFTLVGE